MSEIERERTRRQDAENAAFYLRQRCKDAERQLKVARETLIWIQGDEPVNLADSEGRKFTDTGNHALILICIRERAHQVLAALADQKGE